VPDCTVVYADNDPLVLVYARPPPSMPCAPWSISRTG